MARASQITTPAKHPGGRPTKYDPSICQRLIDYFDREPFIKKGGRKVINDPPTMAEFAALNNLHRETLLEWSKSYPQFSDAYEKAKQLQESYFVANGVRGLGNTAFIIFAMKNVCGWRDVREQTKIDVNIVMAQLVAEIKTKVGDPTARKVLANALRESSVPSITD